jgi:hypothetical protein
MYLKLRRDNDMKWIPHALLGDLVVGEVRLSVNGGSRVEIQTNGPVRGSANGGSTVTVGGSPSSVDVETEGAARVVTK